MRNIKFRGKCSDSNEWIYGYYFKGFTGIPYILTLHDHILKMVKYYEVYEPSVGQCTGQKDRNGTEIYENDILDVILHSGEHENYIIQWDEKYSSFEAYNKDRSNYIMGGIWDKFEVIGNTFENPELIWGGKSE